MSAPSTALEPCPTCKTEQASEFLLGAARVLHCRVCDGATYVVAPHLTFLVAAEETEVLRRSVGGRLRAAGRRAINLFAPPAAITAEGAWIPCPW